MVGLMGVGSIADRGSEAEGTDRCFLIVRFLGKRQQSGAASS